MAIAFADRIIAIQLPEKSNSALLSAIRKKIGEFGELTAAPPVRIKKIALKIEKHLSGKPQQFDVNDLELSRTPPFFRKVYELSAKIPSGQISTYGEIANKMGKKNAARAVGQAMARNPFPIMIPCHRVMGSTGPGGFSAMGGLHTKAKILHIEGLQ